MVIVAIVGRSGSGKTTLLRKLVPELTGRGLRVGVIKRTHHVVDDPHRAGSDSVLLAEAGATVWLSDTRWATVPDELMAELKEKQLHLVLIEGGKSCDYPKIEVAREAPPLGRGLLAVVGAYAPAGLSALSADDPSEVADFLMRGWAWG